MIFRQLYDTDSSTYTYLLADASHGAAVIIDPVQAQCNVYLTMLSELHLTLKWILETHVHADHITGAGVLRTATSAKIALSELGGAPCADRQLRDGESLVFGDEHLQVIATPGHTPSCLSYLWRDRLFTGDALLIDGCGRTDFQGGNAAELYDSITHKIWSLADETLIYPGHDYHRRCVSSVGQERATNARIAGKSRDEFVSLMHELNLPEPELIQRAVPANQHCGKEAHHASRAT